MSMIKGKQIELDNNPNLGTSDKVIASQNAIKQYVDSQVSQSVATIYAETIPSGVESATIIHNLGTFDYFVSVYDILTKEDVIVDSERLNFNELTIEAGNPNGLRVLIFSSTIVDAGTNGTSGFVPNYASSTPDVIHRTGVLNSATAATPVEIVPNSDITTGRSLHISNFILHVNGATAWSGITSVSVEDNLGIELFSIPVASLTANATVFLSSLNVAISSNILLGTGASIGMGCRIKANSNGTGSNIHCTIIGVSK